MLPPPPTPTLFPYTTLFRSVQAPGGVAPNTADVDDYLKFVRQIELTKQQLIHSELAAALSQYGNLTPNEAQAAQDRKSTRLNSSHANISYAVFCLKKKKREN